MSAQLTAEELAIAWEVARSAARRYPAFPAAELLSYAWQGLEKGRQLARRPSWRGSIAACMRRYAMNYVLDQVRTEARRHAVRALSMGDLGEAPDPAEARDPVERAALEELLGRLSRRERSAVLAWSRGEEQVETARRWGVTPSRVSVTKRQALERLGVEPAALRWVR